MSGSWFDDILSGGIGGSKPYLEFPDLWVLTISRSSGLTVEAVTREYIKMLEAGKTKENARRIVEAKHGCLS